MSNMNNEDEIKDLSQTVKEDIIASRCTGLLGRLALKKDDNKIAFASQTHKKDGPFYCPACLSDVVVRKCSNKIDHFAHHARQSPVLTKKDKELHNKCRDQILQLLQNKFPEGKWEKERPITADNAKGFKEIIPDISGRIYGKPVAIEVQVSSYTVNRMKTKLIEYAKRPSKVAVLYIIPLREDLGDEPFRPRLFEKYLHSLYYGRVYYWTKDSNITLQPVHYSPAARYIAESNWFDVDAGEERSEGGYFLTYKTIRKPNYGKPVDLDMDFFSKFRSIFQPKNVKHGVPECTIYLDNLPAWWNKKELKECVEQAKENMNRMKWPLKDKYEYYDDYDELENESD